jgi:Protein of unknown function (DUF3025)
MLVKTSDADPPLVSQPEGEWLKRRINACCYDSVRSAARRLNFSADLLPDVSALGKLLTNESRPILNASGQAISFADQDMDPSAHGYEAQIFSTGAVPTRPNNVHDLFNALVWASFPRSKAALNARHIAARQQHRAGNNRGPVQDALTLFDECGVIVLSDRPELLACIERFEWKELFWRQREAVKHHMKFLLFGHGLMEQMLQPFIGLTGKALLMNVESTWLQASIDELLQHIDAKSSALIASPACFVRGRDLLPLPLLGIPDWSTDNERESYYDNADYFRPGRRKED